MNTNNTNKYYYGFTYKKNSHPIAIYRDYDAIIYNLKQKFTDITYVYETDSKGRIHIHGIVNLLRKNPLFKTLIPSGYTARFHQIYDMDHWINYLTKEPRNQPLRPYLEAAYNDQTNIFDQVELQQQIDAEWFHTHYAFDQPNQQSADSEMAAPSERPR